MNNRQKIGLSVVAFSLDPSGIKIEARCLDKPLKVGDVLTDMIPGWGMHTHKQQSINLKIDSICLADRSPTAELDPGYGATLHLSGDGADLIQEKCHLIGSRF